MLGLWPVRFRYTLRALFVFLTLFALWGGYHANRAFLERNAESILRRYGAHLAYEPRWTIWPYRFITEVELSFELDQETADAVGNLPHLRIAKIKAPDHRDPNQIDFFESRAPRQSAPPGSIERMLSHGSLTELDLDGWIVSGAACAAIGRQRRLERALLSCCELAEGGVDNIVAAPRLREVRLRDCVLNGTAFTDARGSPTLQQIDCFGTQLPPGFAVFVSHCPNIKFLEVGGVSRRGPFPKDEFFVRLGAHPAIERLDVSFSAMTDESIPTLLKMPALKYASVPETVSEQASETLRLHLHARH